MGRLLQSEEKFLAAHDLAAAGEERFPQSAGGKLCHNLRLELEAPQAGITTERVWNAPWPDISIRYKNLHAVYFRAIPVDWESFMAKQFRWQDNLTDAERREILARAPASEWSTNLPPTPDFKQHLLDLPAPKTLKPGFYFIAAQHARTLPKKKTSFH